MAYPASIKRLDDALSAVDATALHVQAETQILRDRSIVGPVECFAFIGLIRRLDGAVDTWDKATALDGIVGFARDQKGDQTLDVTGEFLAMREAAVDLKNWLFNVFPKDNATGAWLVEEYDEEGASMALEFTAAELSGYVTRAYSLIAAIG